jgi:2-methylisocitrate lyase-like PEP mutase family enzyme
VTADLEAAYGSTPEDAAATARGAIEAGAVGLNFEDMDVGRGALLDLDLQLERIRAMRKVAAELDVPLVINARTDYFLADIGDSDAWRLEQSVERGNRFLQAGADSVFVPGVDDEPIIAELAKRIEGPLNVLAGSGTPPLSRLAQLGVARVSAGSSAMAYVLGQFRRAARNVKDSGVFDFAADRIPHAELNALCTMR